MKALLVEEVKAVADPGPRLRFVPERFVSELRALITVKALCALAMLYNA
jgi:hypothetical protein